MTIHCDLCLATVADTDEAIDQDWNAAYFVGDDQHDPICPRCAASKCHVGDGGELELITDDPEQIVNAVLAESDIVRKIRDRLPRSGVAITDRPYTLSWFVELLETGEATLADFEAAGGHDLAAQLKSVLTASATQCRFTA